MGSTLVRVLVSRLGTLWEVDWEPSLKPPAVVLSAALLVTGKEHSKGLEKEQQSVLPLASWMGLQLALMSGPVLAMLKV